MILPMITAAIMLGRTFRLDEMAVGKTIFDRTEIENNKVVIENPFTRTQYKMIESSSDVNDFMNVEGELSLFQKSNKIEFKGSGKYLFETVDRTKTVELLLSVTTQQKIETIPVYIKQEDGWDGWTGLGTHYIRSIVYGGQLLITYKMVSTKAENMEEIKAVVKANLETSGSVSAELQGKLEKIKKELSGKCQVFIHAYSSGDITPQPSNLEQVFQYMDDFPKQLETYSKTKAYLPMKFELEPLSNLNPKFALPITNRQNEILDEAIDKFDDVRFAYTQVNGWEPDEYSEEVSAFRRKVGEAKDALKNAIMAIDLSQPLDVKRFEEAFKIYAHDGINIPNRYTIEMHEWKNRVNNIDAKWYPYTRAVDEYIHWGSTHCTLPSPDPIFVGIAGSSARGFGSGSNLQCLEENPSNIRQQLTPDMMKSAINGLTYQTPQGRLGPLLCARCKLENATSIITVPAKKSCPMDTKFEYEGFLATGADSISDPICIDKSPVEEHKGLHWQTDSTANPIKPMWMKCSTCDDDNESVHYLPCVVCSR